jgi:integrase
MTSMRHRLEHYLTLRRALGFKLERAGLWLPDFVNHLERRRAAAITTALALEWANGSPARLTLVRGFAEYLSALDPRTEVPSRELLPWRARRATPYLYSDQDVRRLMDAAHSQLRPLRGHTYATLIGLLAVTGMRVGEAIALDRTDVDWTQGAIVIRCGKFRRSRAVPLHDTALAVLRDYARIRDRSVRHPRAPAFLLSSTGTRLVYKNIHACFLRLVRAAGLPRRSPPCCRPRIHDLRHSFAVRTLIGWYRAGVDVDALLPRLSTYLGHVTPASTYWYLSASPELLWLAAQRADRAHGGRP